MVTTMDEDSIVSIILIIISPIICYFSDRTHKLDFVHQNGQVDVEVYVYAFLFLCIDRYFIYDVTDADYIDGGDFDYVIGLYSNKEKEWFNVGSYAIAQKNSSWDEIIFQCKQKIKSKMMANESMVKLPQLYVGLIMLLFFWVTSFGYFFGIID